MVNRDIDVTDEVRAAAIMNEIREKVRKKMGLGMDVSNMSDILGTPALSFPIFSGQSSPLSGEITFLNNNHKLEYYYLISSHHPIVGKALVKGRELVNGEVRRYIDPMIEQQNRFNYNTAKAIGGHDAYIMSLLKRIDEAEEKNDDLLHALESINPQVFMKLQELSDKVDKELERYSTMIREAASLNDQMYKSLELIKTRNDQIHDIGYEVRSDGRDIDMEAFSARFGGSADNIKELYASFINYYSGCKKVIDVGCGRGFFLDLAQDHDVGSVGIDIGLDFVDICLKKGRIALLTDALTYFDSLEDSSIDGVFMAHVIEHLDHDYIARLISLFNKKLSRGAPVIIITPNIENISVSATSFYMDPTHRSHIHPEFLEFLLSVNGFEIMEKKYYQPTIPESVKLEKLEEVDGHVISVQKLNTNIEKLNNLIFGNRDFAIVAKKQ